MGRGMNQIPARRCKILGHKACPVAQLSLGRKSWSCDRPMIRVACSRYLLGDQRGILHGPSADLLLVRDTVATGLGRLGYRIDSRDTPPGYHARIVVEAFGTTQGLTFFGMPPVQSVIIPFALPALTVYKAEGQKGYTRLHIDFFEYQSGKHVGSSPTLIGRTYYNQYTLLFFWTWQTTDLLAPP